VGFGALAVLPANIFMATAHLSAPEIMVQYWPLCLRIPLQLPLIYCTWLYARMGQKTKHRRETKLQ
jgi:uncharacterized membrane protein